MDGSVLIRMCTCAAELWDPVAIRPRTYHADQNGASKATRQVGPQTSTTHAIAAGAGPPAIVSVASNPLLRHITGLLGGRHRRQQAGEHYAGAT